MPKRVYLSATSKALFYYLVNLQGRNTKSVILLNIKLVQQWVFSHQKTPDCIRAEKAGIDLLLKAKVMEGTI